MSIKSFVEKLDIKNNNNNKLIVYLDSKIYPNEFGISVRPLQVKCGTSIIDMKELIDIFGKVPYITVKENRYRSVYRDPMIMTIDLTPKEYKDNTYYEYYIDKLCLRNELKKYISIEKKAHEVIHEFKKSQSDVQDVETYRDSRCELDDVKDSSEIPI